MSNKEIADLKKSVDALQQIKGKPKNDQEQENQRQLEQVVREAAILLEQNPENRYIMLLLGQALTKSRLFEEARVHLDQGSGLVNSTPNEPDFWKMCVWYCKSRIQLGVEMQSGGRKQDHEAGFKLEVEARYQLAEAARSNDKAPVYSEQLQAQLKTLKKRDDHPRIEELFLSVYRDEQFFTKEQRFQAIASVFHIDRYYTPKTKVEDLYLDVLSLLPQEPGAAAEEGKSAASSAGILGQAAHDVGASINLLSESLLKSVERKDLQFLNNLDNLDQFKKLHHVFMEAYKVAEPAMVANPALKFSPRYEKRVCFELLFNQFGENKQFFTELTEFRASQAFKENLATLNEGKSQGLEQLCLLVIAILDIAAYLKLTEAHDDSQGELFSQLSVDQISNMQLRYSQASFIPCLYRLCQYQFKKEKQNHLNITDRQLLDENAKALIDFVNSVSQRLEVNHDKLKYEAQIIMINNLDVKLQKESEKDYQDKFNSLKDQLILLDNSKANQFKLLKLQYQVNLNINGWKDAINVLEQLAECANQMEEQESDFKLDKILSEKAWISYSFADQIVESEEEKKKLIQASTNMLVDAIKANPQNVIAKTRLGTLIHLFGKTHLDDFEMSQKEKNEQTQWLLALKGDSQNPELFYCIGLYYYMHKGDLKKGQTCIEKAITLKPNFVEAQYLLCIILMTTGHTQRAIEIIDDIEANQNRMLPFTYLFKGVHEFRMANYVLAVEHFQNSTKFYNYHQTQIKANAVSMMKPSYPLLQDSIKQSKQAESARFKQLFGIYGEHRYTVTVWQYLTQCYHRIKRYGAALKCLYKTFEELQKTIEDLKGENKIQKQAVETHDIIKQLRNYVSEEQEQLALEEDEKFNSIIQSIRAANQESIVQCIPFLATAANVFLEHDAAKSMIASKYALEILGLDGLNEEDTVLVDRILQDIVDALTKQIQQREVTIEEQRPMLKHRCKQILSEIIRCLIGDEQKDGKVYSMKLRFLMSKGLCILSNSPELCPRDQALSQALEQIEKILLQQKSRSTQRDLLEVAFLNTLLLEKSKILFNLNRFEEAKKLIIDLIKQDPENAQYWVQLHFYTYQLNFQTSKQALFKAYEINPSSTLVLNTLISFYYKNKEYSKFFQALQLAQKLNPQNPHVISILITLNAYLGFLNDTMKKEERAEHVLEAIYLARNYDLKVIKHDPNMVQLAQVQLDMLYQALIFMMHQDGNAKNLSGIDFADSYSFINLKNGDKINVSNILGPRMINMFIQQVSNQLETPKSIEDHDVFIAETKRKLQNMKEAMAQNEALSSTLENISGTLFQKHTLNSKHLQKQLIEVAEKTTASLFDEATNSKVGNLYKKQFQMLAETRNGAGEKVLDFIMKNSQEKKKAVITK